MREFIKRQIASFDPSYFERALATSIMSNKFCAVRDSQHFSRREDMWLEALRVAGEGPLSFFEFGVFQGYSLRFFAEHNSDPKSRFFGFDSFTGLPEDWTNGMRKGAFDQGGKMPEIDDPRVSFVKGWFQNSLPPFLDKEGGNIYPSFIVHYDADLYSSTLYCLATVDSVKQPYLAIFDEFIGHETRALYNYSQMSGATVEFLGWTGDNRNWPDRAMCWIRPQKAFQS